MGENQMSLLFRLPDALLSVLLSEWMSIVEAARLDSAMCNTVLRKTFVQSIYKSKVLLLYTCIRSKRHKVGYNACKIEEWILAKRVQVAGFQASDAFVKNHDIRKDYLQQYGHNIRWMQYDHNCFYSIDDATCELACQEIAEHCPNLQRLDAMQILGAAAVLKIVHRCPLLMELSLCGSNCDDEVVRELARKSTLRRVELVDMDVKEELLVALVRSNRSLRCLNVSASGVAVTFVRELALSCQELTNVVLSKFSADQAEWLLLLTQCNHLRSITIKGCKWLSAVHLTDQSTFFGSIRKVTLEGVDITVPQLHDLLRACPVLTALSLYYCQLLGDLKSFPFGSYCPSLQQLALYGNFGFLGDAALFDIAAHCPDLRELGIPRSHDATDAGLTAMLVRCPLLRDLNISFCNKVTHGTLTAIAEHGRSMSALCISGCRGITKDDVTELVRRCPQLTVKQRGYYVKNSLTE
jgi:hypothetical protein